MQRSAKVGVGRARGPVQRAWEHYCEAEAGGKPGVARTKKVQLFAKEVAAGIASWTLAIGELETIRALE
eukprot:112693-Alexandrium_andersonii.AAC.1